MEATNRKRIAFGFSRANAPSGVDRGVPRVHFELRWNLEEVQVHWPSPVCGVTAFPYPAAEDLMIEILHDIGDSVLTIRLAGELTANDYEAAAPEFENALVLNKGPARILIRVEDFRGWDLDALWKGLRVEAAFAGRLGRGDRIAIVGETGAEKWSANLAALFLQPTVEYFSLENEEEASRWLKS